MEYWDDDEMIKRSEENSGRHGKVGWILSKGLSVGKMILVTGFVISSAPVIVPPFVVISAIGFACSLPYGLFLASYALTGQLMTKLLPSSSNKLVVVLQEEDYYYYNYGESKDMSVAGGRPHRDVIIDDVAGNEEFEEPILSSDINYIGSKKGVLIRQGFFKDDDHQIEHDDDDDDEEDVEDHEAKLEKPVDVIEQGGIGKEEVVLLDETSHQVMIIVNEEYGSSTTAGASHVLKEEEEEELSSTSTTETLLIEKTGDEGTVDDDEAAAVLLLPLQLDDEIKTSSTGSVENNIAEGENIDTIGRSCRNAQDTAGRINDSPRMDLQERRGGMGQDIVEENTMAIPICQSEEVKEMVSSSSTAAVDLTEMIIQPILQNVAVMSSTVSLEKLIDVDDSAKLGREQRNSIASGTISLVPNEQQDAREIADESGLHLFDDKQAAVGFEQCNYPFPQGGSSEQSSYQAYEVTLPTTVDGSKEIITSEEDNQLAAGNGKVVLYSEEEKIWKQIHAVRAIVGYTAAVQGTCNEELKALYLFTGVEPPPSFEDPSDLVEVNDKLRSLMTIVGVK